MDPPKKRRRLNNGDVSQVKNASHQEHFFLPPAQKNSNFTKRVFSSTFQPRAFQQESDLQVLDMSVQSSESEPPSPIPYYKAPEPKSPIPIFKAKPRREVGFFQASVQSPKASIPKKDESRRRYRFATSAATQREDNASSIPCWIDPHDPEIRVRKLSEIPTTELATLGFNYSPKLAPSDPLPNEKKLVEKEEGELSDDSEDAGNSKTNPVLIDDSPVKQPKTNEKQQEIKPTTIQPPVFQKSKFIGVSYDMSKQQWEVKRISNDGKNYFSGGLFEEEMAAALASDALVRKNGLWKMHLNFPTLGECRRRHKLLKDSQKSGYFHVYQSGGMWMVAIWKKGSNVWGNMFEEIEQAALAADRIWRHDDGDPCKLNFPTDEDFAKVIREDNSSKDVSKSTKIAENNDQIPVELVDQPAGRKGTIDAISQVDDRTLWDLSFEKEKKSDVSPSTISNTVLKESSILRPSIPTEDQSLSSSDDSSTDSFELENVPSKFLNPTEEKNASIELGNIFSNPTNLQVGFTTVEGIQEESFHSKPPFPKDVADISEIGDQLENLRSTSPPDKEENIVNLRIVSGKRLFRKKIGGEDYETNHRKISKHRFKGWTVMDLSKGLSVEELKKIPGCNNIRARHIFALLNSEILKLNWFLQFKGVLSSLTRKRLALRIKDDVLYRSKLYSLTKKAKLFLEKRGEDFSESDYSGDSDSEPRVASKKAPGSKVFKLAMEAGSKKVWGTKRRRPPVIYADSDLDAEFSNDSDSSAIEVMKSSSSPHRVLDTDEENPPYENLAPPEIFSDGKVYFYNILRQQVSERMPELEPNGVEAAIMQGWEALPLEKKQYYSDLSQEYCHLIPDESASNDLIAPCNIQDCVKSDNHPKSNMMAGLPTGFEVYFRSMLESISDNVKLSYRKILCQARTCWKVFSDDQKAPYLQRANDIRIKMKQLYKQFSGASSKFRKQRLMMTIARVRNVILRIRVHLDSWKTFNTYPSAKQSGMPAPPLSAFETWMEESWNRYSESTRMRGKKLHDFMTSRWEVISSAEKKPYTLNYQVQMKSYQEALESYMEKEEFLFEKLKELKWTVESLAPLPDIPPSHLVTAYRLFYKHVEAKARDDLLPGDNVASVISQQWRSLTTQQRKPWIEQERKISKKRKDLLQSEEHQLYKEKLHFFNEQRKVVDSCFLHLSTERH